jgi:hypothetical protein
MRSRALALAALLAACAAPAPPPAPPPPLPPLAEAALAEWRAWGGVVVEGWPDLRPTETAATSARFERLLGYWEAIPGGSAVARRHAVLRSALAERRAGEGQVGDFVEDIYVYSRPAWSAAFIGAVARQAGLPRGDLPGSPTHARYIDALLARAAAEPETAPFLPFAPEERPPKPGDLLCADRSWRPLAHWSLRLAERGRPRPMHCDIVVRAAPGVVEAVGGNVEDMVVLRRLPADGEGRVLPAPPGRAPIVLILAAR